MLHLCDIRKVRKAQNIGLEPIAKQLRTHRGTLDRLEKGDATYYLTAIARALKLNICLLTEQECEILAQFNAILAKNGQKLGK
jgi:transcriptional regulator with XRE-family HTH domain